MRASLDIPLNLSEIISAVGGFTTMRPEERVVSGITTDTREMHPGDLFIAIEGANFNGESFCRDAEDNGCICISKSYKDGILVKDTEAALCDITALYRRKLTALKKVIAITGSVGKTTTKEMLKALLSPHKRTHATEGNLNNYIGLAHTVLTCPADAEILIAEMGMNHTSEIKRMSRAIAPNVAVITKIGTAHIGNLGSREMIAKAKLEITEGLSDNGILIIPYGEELLSPTCRYKTVSLSEESSDIAIIPIDASRCGTRFVFNQKGVGAEVCLASVFGSGNLRALAFAAACALESGLSVFDVKIAFSHISINNTRQNVFEWRDREIIDDSYNASLESVISAFELLRFFGGRRCAVLGDILELGSHTESIHFKIGAEAVGHGIELLFLHGVYAPFTARGAICAGMQRDCIFINSDPSAPQITLKSIKEQTQAGDVVLFKASHRCNFSDMIKQLISDGKDVYAG